MNKNNIINFIKYILFTGILYFIIQNISKLSLANIGEFEILHNLKISLTTTVDHSML